MRSLGDSSLRSAPAVARKGGTLSSACRQRIRVVNHRLPPIVVIENETTRSPTNP
jgi:hypothetical protein